MNNKITIHGTMQSIPVYSHSSGIEDFYSFTIQTARTSGTYDSINVIASECILSSTTGHICVTGQIREKSFRDSSGKHKRVYVLADSIVPSTEDDSCICNLLGTLCKVTEARLTPKGKTIVDFTIAINKSPRKAFYLPCIAWGRLAQAISSLPIGTELKTSGRLQSRNYTKRINESTEEIKMINEVSINDITFLNC